MKMQRLLHDCVWVLSALYTHILFVDVHFVGEPNLVYNCWVISQNTDEVNHKRRLAWLC